MNGIEWIYHDLQNFTDDFTGHLESMDAHVGPFVEVHSPEAASHGLGRHRGPPTAIVPTSRDFSRWNKSR